MLVYTVLVAAACGGPDAADGLGSGDAYGVLGALSEIPASAAGDGPVLVFTADLVTASELNGLERPDEPDTGIVVPWVNELTGFPQGGIDGEVAPVWVPLAGFFNERLRDIDDFDDALGWSLIDVDAFVELAVLPDTLTVVTGDFDETTLPADLGPVGDGVVSFGDGDDYQLGEPNPVSPLGAPTRLAADGTQIAASPSTAVVKAWLGGPEETLADNSSLAAVAEALDDAGAISAVVNEIDVGLEGVFGASAGRASAEVVEALMSEVEGQVPSAPFDAVGIGWAVDDAGETAITVAYHFPTGDDAAAAAVESFRDLYVDGESLWKSVPIADFVVLDNVTSDGPVAVVSLGVGDRGRPDVAFRFLIERDLPFLSR